MKRYHVLDVIRGITLCSMILYHAVWDFVYMFGHDWKWYRSDFAYAWQQSICWSFILLSGFCFSLGKKRVRRGLTVLAAGTIVSLVTRIAMPGQSVRFGVLTMLGSSMLLLAFLEMLYGKVQPKNLGTCGTEENKSEHGKYAGWASVFSFLLFFITRGINQRYLGFETLCLVELPNALYNKGDLMTYIGFMSEEFYSTDYFSIMPWFFLFLTGYFLFHCLNRKQGPGYLGKISVDGKVFRFMGRHSLGIYLLHQPLIYFALLIVHKI